MRDEPWVVAVYGIAAEEETAAVRQVTIRWREGAAGGEALVTVAGRSDVLRYDLPRGTVPALLAFLFGGGRGGDRAVPPDPINLDGTPRNGLKDRLARKGLGEMESLAAD